MWIIHSYWICRQFVIRLALLFSYCELPTHYNVEMSFIHTTFYLYTLSSLDSDHRIDQNLVWLIHVTFIKGMFTGFEIYVTSTEGRDGSYSGP